MKNKSMMILAAFASLSVMTVCNVQAQNNFGQSWRSMPAAAADQVRIVYYRPADAVSNSPANIYVDGEFQTSLLAGGYSTFCLSPGVHSLGSFTNDAPSYQGKQQQPWRDNLAAGKTYYIRASLDGSGRPLVTSTTDAQQQLVGTRQQTHLLSRASSVVACQQGTTQSYDNYTFSSDLLFKFASANSDDISDEGRRAIQQFTAMLKQQSNMQAHIVVSGFTDPIGDEESNMKLGQRRADAIKKLLVNNGLSSANISSQSMGESQVSKQCQGTRKELVACYASERRVIISVENK
ncbi:membrane protein [Pantoea sp. RIT-PI-b]|uniref:OmpA family protein n=1 Tax=Pantoea sp. RIT-PI-b TaxID=1681195 RepID=UPI000675FBE0|nr:OmpA family protein [Pantoea sp. RIT-PI-b]KNC17524.1 membrane protein [Pantoea sp. RIT-PI-b]